MKRAVVALAVGLSLVSGAAAQGDPEVAFWLEEARGAMVEGEAGRARSALERVLAADPGNPEARDLMRRLEPAPAVRTDEVASALASGMLDGQVLSPEEALARLRENPYAPEAPRWKARLGEHYFQQAQQAEKEGKAGRSMVAFRRAIFFAPEEPLIRYEMFQALMRRDRLVEALEQAEVFLELQDEGALAREMQRQLVEVHTRLGSKKMKANRWDAAIEHFRKVLAVRDGPRRFGEVEEKLAVCYYTLGVREKASKRTREACLNFSLLLEMRPEDGLARETFDRAYLDKLRSNALSPLWNQGKASKEEGRLLEAYRFFGHVLTLGTQGWMLKLSRKYRSEIEELAGESVALEEARLRRGLGPSPEASQAVAPPLMVSPGQAPDSAAVAPPPEVLAAPSPGGMASPPPLATSVPPPRVEVDVGTGAVPAPPARGAPLAARPGTPAIPPRPPAPQGIPSRPPQDLAAPPAGLEGEGETPALGSRDLDRLLYGNPGQ